MIRLLTTSLLLACADQAPSDSAPLADFTLALADGGELRLGDLQGEVVVIDLSWYRCGTCQSLAPDAADWARAHPEVQLVTALTAPTLDEVVVWADTFGLTHPAALDEDGELYQALDPGAGRPGIAVLNRAGEVDFVGVGRTAHDEALARALELSGG